MFCLTFPVGRTLFIVVIVAFLAIVFWFCYLCFFHYTFELLICFYRFLVITVLLLSLSSITIVIEGLLIFLRVSFKMTFLLF